MKVKLHLYFYFVGVIMKFLKSEKWKLEETTKRVCLFTTIYYGVVIYLMGLIQLIGFVDSFLPIELYDSYERFMEGFVFIYGIILFPNLLLYVTKIIYFIPVIIAIFLISVAFIELVKRKNPRVFVHPLVLFSIAISFVGTFVIVYFVENSF
jgi:hypothetical protein